MTNEEKARKLAAAVAELLPSYGHTIRLVDGEKDLETVLLSALEFFPIHDVAIQATAEDACQGFSESVPPPEPVTPLGKAICLVLVALSLNGKMAELIDGQVW